MKKQIKHGPEFARELEIKKDNIVRNLLCFIVGVLIGVLIMTFK